MSERLLEEWHRKNVYGDHKHADPEELSQYLAAMCYAKRNKSDPFFIEGILAGVKDGHKTLTFVDLYGTKFTDKYIATSFARSIASPIIDATYRDDMGAQEAKQILIDSFKALIARHKLFSKSLVMVLVTEDGVFEDKVEIGAKYDYIGYKTREDLF